MSKADRLRELQEENNKLKFEIVDLKAKLLEWQKRATPQLSDFIKPEKEEAKE